MVIYMRINEKKELALVFYGNSAVKILHRDIPDSNRTCFTAHWHERIELTYVVSGNLTLTVNGRAFKLTKGLLGIISPEKEHTAVSGENGVEYYTVMFDPTAFYNSAFATEKYLTPIIKLKTDFVPVTDDPEIIGTVSELIREQLNGDEYSALSVIGRIYILLSLFYRKCRTESSSVSIPKSGFSEILDYIEKNCCNGLTTAKLSRTFGYTEAHFCRLFKAETGITPTGYINILRVERAKKLLETGMYKASEVAVKCGFSDSGYFARVYKKHFGASPRATVRDTH